MASVPLDGIIPQSPENISSSAWGQQPKQCVWTSQSDLVCLCSVPRAWDLVPEVELTKMEHVVSRAA
jgi:hypothetical protein